MATTINNALAAVTGSTTSTTAKSATSSALGQDEFMTMLLAQLKNQDPLNPMDGKDFAAQLAQFSSLQQLSNLNTTMSSLPTYLQAFSNTQMATLIGQNALAKGNVITVSGAQTNINFSLPSDIKTGTIKIYNESGAQVGNADLGSLKSGVNSIAWNTSGVTAGNYTFEISAKDASGNAVTADTLIFGAITGVAFKDDTSYLTINGQDVKFSNVVAINKSTN